MNKQFKKVLSSALSLAMIASSIVLPVTASAETTPIFEGDTVLKEWKFDFGAEGSTPKDGYTLVTPDTSFVTNKAGDEQYGFLGIGEEDYKLTNRYDGWTTQKGQVIELAAGGTAENSGIGVVGAGGTDEENKGGKGNDIFGNKGDVYYPTRFALKVADDTYYRIRATVTTLDPAKDAEASLYTERKHPLYTKKTIAAGTSETTDFTVRVTPIYYEKEAPTGQIKDEMVTVGVLGENAALVSVVIQQVETAPTLWVLGDSTVTDGNTTLPFFPLQNYTGVGTGLTKYLRRDYAMVNEGEGGLNAADNNHFNMVKTRIKAGDYMYVEYGHNHKSDGPTGYKGCLDKYYNACHAAGAKLIIVSPVQSDNDWDVDNKKWKDRFGGETNFAGVGKAWVAEKVASGATDVAFADLTKTSVAFVDKVTAEGGNLKTAAQFYYQTPKDGGTDPSHPNDTGAENFAYCFFEAAKENDDTTQKAVLADLLANMTDETPNLVPADVVAGGLGKAAWPQYIVQTAEKYPVVIDNVEFNEDGTAKQVDVTVRDAEIPFATYGIIVITIYNADGTEKGKIYASDQVDHSTGKGPQTIVNFRGDVTLGENDTYSAVVVEALDSNDGLQVVEGGKVYSAVYKPTDIEKILITNEDNTDIEKFDFFGATYGGESPSSLEAYNGWTKRGSAGISLNLNEGSIGKYVSITSDGAKNGVAAQGSFYVAKDFVTEKVMDGEEEKEVVTDIGSTGRYIVSFDAKFVSGGAIDNNTKANRGLEARFVTGNSDKTAWGTESITLFTIGKDGAVTANDGTVIGKAVGTVSATAFTNVQYILDMDLGKAYVTVGGGDEIEVDVPNYQTESTTVSPSKLTGFMFGGDKVAFAVDVANLTVGKLKAKELPEYIIGVRANNPAKGSVELSWATPEPEETPNATNEPTVTLAGAADKPELLSDDAHNVTFVCDDKNVYFEVYKDETMKEKINPPYTLKENEEMIFSFGGLGGGKNIKLTQSNGDLISQKNYSVLSNITEDTVVTLTYSDIPKAEDGDLTLTVTNDQATVTSNTEKEISAKLIIAKYDGNGVLSKLDSKGIVFKYKDQQKTFDVEEGEKVMLWDSLEGMKPITEAKTVPSVPYTEETLALNTVVTVKAEANEGFVFMGWLDEKGTKVSDDAEYSFRLRSDKKITANFVKEPGVEDITNYSITADSTFIKSAAGTTTTMKIVDPVDAAGTPMDKVTNADVTWTSSDENVKVDTNGVVTIGENFTTDGKDTKAVTITGVLNGITKTCVITTYSYAYYEEMVDGSTNFEGTFMKIAGKTAIVFPGASTSWKYTMTAPVKLDKPTTILYSNAWSLQNTCGQLRTLNFLDSKGTIIFSIPYTWASIKIGETELANAVAKDKWQDVTVTIDPETKVVTVTVGESSATTTLTEGAEDIAGIEFNSASSVPAPDARALGISSFKVTQ